jgi:hypothetical protein
MRQDLDLLRNLLANATARIAPEYFLLPVADAEGGEPLVQYRERVYAYELYHQLRQTWPDHWPYSLAGEIDKRGHPIVRGGILDNAKPDLLVHVSGQMDRNLAVIEIKPLRGQVYRGEREAFQRDMKKLIAFREIGYRGAFLIAFGESVDRIREYAHDLRQSGIDLNGIELYHHRRSGESATPAEW